LTNAVRYGGTEVTVEATELGERTMLSIRDNGPGLPEAEWERIFEPYERAHDTPTQPASIGLGLTVSRQLARLMDGDLTYESDGSSSVFKLVLPAAERDDRAGQAVPSLADSTRAV
jgi:two-component system sensor histidine kinase KdpD